MANLTIPFWEAVELSGGHIAQENGMMIPRDTNIGLEHYPIFDERHRDTLNSHIVARYYNQEIGFPTTSEFRMRLSAELALNMPTFNKMYEANLLDFDPLSTMRVVNESEGSSESQGTNESIAESTSHAGGKGRTVFSDTPQQRLAGNADYASNLTDVTNENDNASTASDIASAEQSVATQGKSVTTGYNQSPASLVRQRQELLLNVDLLVVESLEKLFLGIWQTYDNYTEGYYV